MQTRASCSNDLCGNKQHFFIAVCNTNGGFKHGSLQEGIRLIRSSMVKVNCVLSCRLRGKIRVGSTHPHRVGVSWTEAVSLFWSSFTTSSAKLSASGNVALSDKLSSTKAAPPVISDSASLPRVLCIRANISLLISTAASISKRIWAYFHQSEKKKKEDCHVPDLSAIGSTWLGNSSVKKKQHFRSTRLFLNNWIELSFPKMTHESAIV